jgi:simple sugar transport system substrate-binding protein
VTTNPFFVPTRYGAEDACKLLGCSYQWTGSENSNVNEMVNAFNTAVTAAPTASRSASSTRRRSTPDRRGAEGQDPGRRLQRGRAEQRAARLHRPGPVRLRQEMGKRISDLVPSGDVALFIATPGQSEHPAAHRRRAQTSSRSPRASRRT